MYMASATERDEEGGFRGKGERRQLKRVSLVPLFFFEMLGTPLYGPRTQKGCRLGPLVPDWGCRHCH